MRKRRIVLLFIGLLLALNVALALVQSTSALPLALSNKLLGPNMIRAEILWKSGGVQHDYLLDSGRIRTVTPTSITIVEKDGKVLTIAVAPEAEVVFRGGAVPIMALRRGMRAVTYRDGNAPAFRVEASMK
ncbi:MAG TPA: hypothetical protein VF101_15060 [Gaiellaceae bacterium]